MGTLNTLSKCHSNQSPFPKNKSSPFFIFFMQKRSFCRKGGGYENESRCHLHKLWQLVFFLPIAVGNIFSTLGRYRNCQRMNYAPKINPQIEETVRKVDTTRMLVDTNWPFFGIRHP
ncbi:hypothetical protein BK664_13960 [Pseudomonas brassicacearum]|uniref:Uncharacterized protein n=1 Tax=Pseudomonas brassicacearum TaxID=930166 RepID=A0A423JLC8_9PSED|nr:hypothetical protein [Pseudomonas brassicacearum]RON38442.1 hypothetical protein BK664_13960 [Pseudomonas brassicacearum]